MEANAITPVVLGLLRHGPRSGYDIKVAVDGSTRFFWAASYGQIYPELKRLEGARLIEARPGQDPTFVDLVLRWGIDFNEWGAEWCRQQLERLRDETPAA